MSVLTLLTDFGLADSWVGIMKGVILKINPGARIVDLTHQIPPQDTAAAAWTLAAAYPYFPRGSVHIVVVDPGVGSDRHIICAAVGGHIFLAPDNGVLSAVLKAGVTAEDLRIVTNRDLCLDRISHTFHGRDIFAPVGAHLSLQESIAAVGPRVASKDLVRLDLPEPVLAGEGELRGTVILIDRFGNLVTNIDRRRFAALCGEDGRGRTEILLGSHRITGLKDAYARVDRGQALALFGSMGYLEIAVNGGHAGRRLGIEPGDPVRVTCSR